MTFYTDQHAIEQELQKGIEAHKAGKVQEAEQHYTAILKTNPKHPDANHNMGVLAIGVGKVEKSLPYFEAAIETNPKVSKFWLSYIGALLKLDQKADAKAVFDQAESKEVQGDISDKLAQQIGSSNSMYSSAQEPSPGQVQSIIDLFNQKKYQEAFTKNSQLLEEFSRSVNLYNILGGINQRLGRLEEATEAYKKALAIKPDSNAYTNMGVALHKQGKLEEAIQAYIKALSITPHSEPTYYNMGNTLKDLGRLEEAIEAYKKALSIKPDSSNTIQSLMKCPYGSLSKEWIDIAGDFLKKISDKIANSSELKFLEANYLMHDDRLDLAFDTFCEANNKKLISAENFEALDANYHTFEKKLKSWKLDFVPNDNKKLIKIFILAPPRSGQSQLETLLSKSQIIKPLSDAIKLQTDSTNYSFEEIFFQNEMHLRGQGFKVITTTNPHSIFHAIDIAEKIPNSFFIFIERDKIDVASEIFRSHWKKKGYEFAFAYDPKNICRLIKFYTETAEIFLEKLVKNSISISFEEILFEPKNVVSMIEKLCSISCDLQELDFTKSQIPVSSVFRNQFQEKFLSS